jgi:membrane-associated phospholipid phosphatase
MNRLVKIISVVFHPLIMPVLGILVLFYSGTYLSFIPENSKRMILVLVVSGMFLLPVSLVPVYYYRKLLSSFEVSKKSERLVPLFITTILYYLTFYILKKIPVPILILGLVGSATISLFVLTLITLRYNISLHAAGTAGLLGFLLAMALRIGLFAPFCLYCSIALAGLVGAARLRLNLHTPSEVYLGYLVGFAICFGFNYYYRI